MYALDQEETVIGKKKPQRASMYQHRSIVRKDDVVLNEEVMTVTEQTTRRLQLRQSS